MFNDAVLLSSAYLAPIQYYTKLFRYPTVGLDAHEFYQKQTYRNRCLIASPNGIQALTVPIVKPEPDKCAMKDIRISDHGNWRHLHWNALESAYRNSPFFEYYADDFLPFYTRKWNFLFDFNEDIRQKVCELIDIQPHVVPTVSYGCLPEDKPYDDFRQLISPKPAKGDDPDFLPVEYYQVFREKLGFIPDLSIADLLFNMGPESILVLKDSLTNEKAEADICMSRKTKNA